MHAQWARPYPRAVLAALLTARREDVPRYATRSDLAAVLADSLLVERCGAYYCDVEIDDFENGIVGNRKQQQQQQQQQAAPATVAAQQAPRQAAVARPRPPASPLTDPFFFEKELAAQAWARLAALVGALLAGPPKEALQAAQSTVLGALLRAVVFGTKAVRTLALWAGGDVFAPNHVRFSRRLAHFFPTTDNIYVASFRCPGHFCRHRVLCLGAQGCAQLPRLLRGRACLPRARCPASARDGTAGIA